MSGLDQTVTPQVYRATFFIRTADREKLLALCLPKRRSHFMQTNKLTTRVIAAFGVVTALVLAVGAYNVWTKDMENK